MCRFRVTVSAQCRCDIGNVRGGGGGYRRGRRRRRMRRRMLLRRERELRRRWAGWVAGEIQAFGLVWFGSEEGGFCLEKKKGFSCY
ncbi:putative protease Do-like 14 [Iris pallida]|uniref:Protease Do-like 14 n=1 Tax=Iris pallida TaxID=29817 RepID=A0AAX6HMJ4_IRIPA|nr:putative protease Do-like 14 [Iris pallida]KAJ6841555.1 putative protease Do-like 14 [Iris pallida]